MLLKGRITYKLELYIKSKDKWAEIDSKDTLQECEKSLEAFRELGYKYRIVKITETKEILKDVG